MTWNALVDFTTGRLVSASDWNKMMGATGNLSETAVAKATAAGQIPYATGDKALAMLGVGTAGQVLRVNSGATAPEWGALSAAMLPPVKRCRAESGGPAIPDNVETAVAWNGSDTYDPPGWHNPASNSSRITVDLTGVFLVRAQISFFASGTTGYRGCFLRKNGTGFSSTLLPAWSGNFNSVGATDVVEAAAGDYFEVFAYQNSGASLLTTGVATYSFFDVVYLGPQ